MGNKGYLEQVEVGDLIRWYEPDYPYYFIYEEYNFKAPKYGIVTEVHIPDLGEANDIDFGFGARGNAMLWDADMAWIKVLTIGENLKKSYIYLDFDEKYEVVSKVSRRC